MRIADSDRLMEACRDLLRTWDKRQPGDAMDAIAGLLVETGEAVERLREVVQDVERAR